MVMLPQMDVVVKSLGFGVFFIEPIGENPYGPSELVTMLKERGFNVLSFAWDETEKLMFVACSDGQEPCSLLVPQIQEYLPNLKILSSGDLVLLERIEMIESFMRRI